MKILLDYDNTICNFSQMMCNKWNKLSNFAYQAHPFYIEDIKYYSLHKCLLEKGYSEHMTNFCIDTFWSVPNIYQDEYIDMPCKDIIFKEILYPAWFEGNEIILHTMCCSEEMAASKIQRIYDDYDLLKYISEVKMDILIEKKKYIKDTNYDIVIDDNPDFILKFLKDNPKGRAFVPRWCYNDIPGINDNDRVTMIG